MIDEHSGPARPHRQGPALALTTGALILGACQTPPPPKPTPEPPKPAIFVVQEGSAKLLQADGTVLKAVEVGFEADVSVWDAAARRAIVLGERGVFSVDVDGLSPVLVAALDSLDTACLGEGPASGYVQSHWDVGLEEDGGGLCVRLQDRNDNMASFAMEVRVGMDKGTLVAAPVFDLDGCVEAEAEPPCHRAVRQPPASGSDDESVEVDPEACLVYFGGGDVLDMGGFELADGCPELVEGVSASGRFVGLSTPTGSGDYLYRRLIIVDRAEKRHLAALDVEIVGETRVQWSEEHEAVLVGEHLMVLGDAPRKVVLDGSAVWLEE